jgi:hypothetical protein
MRLPFKTRGIQLAAIFALVAWFHSAASLAQNLPVNTVAGPGDQVVNDVIVMSDGSKVFAGRYSEQIAVGHCPGTGCLTETGSFGGFVARVDAQGNAVWLQTFQGGSVSSLLMADDVIYAVGTAISGLVNIGSASIGSTTGPSSFVAAIDGGGALKWVAGAKPITFNHAALIGRDEAEYLVLGGGFTCGFESLPTGSTTLNGNCGTSGLLVAALKLRGRFSDPTDNGFINEDWEWLTQDENGETVLSLAATPSGVVYVETGSPGKRLLRISNTYTTTPLISSVFNSPGLTNGDLEAVDDRALIYAGALTSPNDFGILDSPMVPGAFIGRLNVGNPNAVVWDWVTSVNGSVSNGLFSDVTVSDNAVFAAGEFLRDVLTIHATSSGITPLGASALSSSGRAGMLVSLDLTSGELRTTGASEPWIFGGDGSAYSFSELVIPNAINTDGLGRLAIGGSYNQSFGPPIPTMIGTEAVPYTAGQGFEGFTALVSVNGTPISDEDWIVGQALTNPIPILSVADRPQTFRNGTAFDAYAQGYLYFDPPDPNAEAPEGRVIPLSASAEPIEIVWDPLGIPISQTRAIRWPANDCVQAGGAPCSQRHVASAPVELNSTSHTFRQLFNPPENGSDAMVNLASAAFNATTAGFAVVRYEDSGGRVVLEVVRTDTEATALGSGPARVVPIGAEIRPPSGYPQQPDRPGFALNELAYIDANGPTAAYDRPRRLGHIIPVNRTNPFAGQQALKIAWYRGNSKGVFWPDRVDAYDPQWPDEARGLIISAVGFSPNGCSERPRIQLHNARLPTDSNGGVIDLFDYVLVFPNQSVQLRNVLTGTGLIGPGESFEIPQFPLTVARLCRDQSVVLMTELGQRVDQLGDPAVTEVWQGGPVGPTDMILVRNENVCLGNADRANPFSVGLEWQPAGTIDDHEIRCTEKIIIASQAGSEVSGRDFPTDLIISQYVEDGPSADGVANQNQAVEIFNGALAAVAISAYDIELRRFGTGPTPVVTTIPLVGPDLQPGEVHVLGHPNTILRDSGLIDQFDPAMVIDGNDAVVLRLRGGGIIDSFGADSVVTEWASQGVSSRNSNLVRSDRVCEGSDLPPTQFDPHLQWSPQPLLELAGIGSHATDCIRTQAALDPARYIDWSIYAQGDPGVIGFNPNDEHALKAASRIGSGFQAAFALRADFGKVTPGDADNASEPYVLVRYREPVDRQILGAGATGFRVFKVEPISTESRYTEFMFESTAGLPINPPYPLTSVGNCPETRVDGESDAGDRIPPAPFFRDYNNQLWARSANRPGRDAVVRYWYPLAGDFYFGDSRPGSQAGDCIPWMPNLPLNLGGSGDDRPIATKFDIKWPDRPLQLTIGESLIDAKRGMPSIRQAPSVQVVFDEVQETALETPGADIDPRSSLVEYFDPLQSRSVNLATSQIPATIARISDPGSGLDILAANANGYTLPFSLRSRLRFDPANQRLMFGGLYRQGGNDPLLLTNILSDCDAQHLRDFPAINPALGFDCSAPLPLNPANLAWNAAINQLVALSRNPNGIEQICSNIVRDAATGVLACASPADQRQVAADDILVGYTDVDNNGILERFGQLGVPGVLSAGAAQASGFVTIALNNDPLLSPQPVSLRVIHVGCLAIDGFLSPYQGQVHIIESDGVFDETLALRHSGDFAGRLDQVEFQWCIVEDADSRSPRPPATDGLFCSDRPPQCISPHPNDPQSCLEWDFFAGSGAGTPEISISGATPRTLSDNWVVARYRFVDDSGQTGLCQAMPDQYSIFAGAPGAPPAEPQAQLAQGWIKRVVDRLNPFDTRVQDFGPGATNTLSSLIAQLGGRFEGDIPLVSTPDNLNSLGIIEAYETVLNRALDFIYGDGGSNSPAPTASSNNAVLLISTRLADLYTALGNEAYADAVDPLVGLTRLELGTIATETFNFKNQLASLLEEELVLLRGRDNTQGSVTARPVYNRLFPNFTGAEGQAAYALAYNISDQPDAQGNFDSIIDEQDALRLFPQGHGDAWGHFLQAMSYHYDLLRRDNFDWQARTENVVINGGPLPVDYLDERKFAANAALKARVGTEVVDLTYRDFYTEDPSGQWQGYKDNRLDRQWGVSEWSSRVGQGAYYDWLTANSIIPAEHRPLAFATEFTAPFCAANGADSFCACLADPGADCDTPSPGFRNYYCALPENLGNPYCNCVNDNGTQVCPLDFPPRGIQVIERGNVGELDDIVNQYLAVQTKIDEVNRGLNPLGISPDAVPFDIDPSRVDQNETHFEQVAERASTALVNAAQVWDFANRINEMLRFNQDDAEDLEEINQEAEFDFNNRLLDIFGSPYPNRIGAGKTYVDGFGGPDLAHYFEVDLPALSGTEFGAINFGPDGSFVDASSDPEYTLRQLRTFYADTADGFVEFDINRTLDNECAALGASPGDTNACAAILNNAGSQANTVVAQLTQLTGPDLGAVFVNPGDGQRRITGELQQAYKDSINARIEFSQALSEYEAHLFDIIALKDQFAETYRTRAEQIGIQTNTRDATRSLGAFIGVSRAAAVGFRTAGKLINGSFKTAASCLPTVVGLASDVTSVVRCSVGGFGEVAQAGFEGLAEVSDGVGNALALAKEDVGLENEIAQFGAEAQLELIGISGDLSSAIEHEPVLRLAVTRKAQDIQATQVRIANLLADGQTVLVERANFRRRTASAVSDYRFTDIAFRQYRNDAIQKYRATFDLAARFVYLAAKAYDYETNLLGSDAQAGQQFLTDIVRHRSIGQLLNGVPIAGSNGLTDSLGQMQANFQVLKGQMGFNNPQIETNRFSLRRELFRIPDADDADYVPDDDRRWAEQLARSRVLDLNSIPEYRRLARPFAPVGSCPQPGLVIEFHSDVSSGSNFFGLELEARDSAYDSSQFATKIRGVGAWFKDYDANILGVSETPRVYLLPIGEDVLRASDGSNFDTRLWRVADQVIPVPFPIGDNDYAQPEWSPGSDSLSDAFALERRIGRFRAYPFRDLGFDQEFSTDSRLISRSVWNSRWLLVIPGATLLGNADQGLDRFVYGQDVPGSFWEDDAVRNRFDQCSALGDLKQAAPEDYVGGVSDILLFFKTYAYSGSRRIEP